MTILKRECEKFLKKSILPLLGDRWFLCSGCSVIRLSGFLLQGICFDRSSYSKDFCPTFFIMVLPIFDDSIILTIGSRIKNSNGGDWWFEWKPEKENFAIEVYQVIEDQAEPKVNCELNLETVISYIERNHLDTPHFTISKSLGILYGLKGRFDKSMENFNYAEKDLKDRRNSFMDANTEPPGWMFEELNSVFKWKSKIDNRDTFLKYCEEEATRTKKALNIGK